MIESYPLCARGNPNRSLRKLRAFLRALPSEARNQWAFTVTCIRVARQIRHMRRLKGWTQAQLADRSGLNVATIIRFEKLTGAGIKNCRIQSLSPIAAAFDCAMIVRFVSWGEWTEWIVTPFGIVKTFSEESGP